MRKGRQGKGEVAAESSQWDNRQDRNIREWKEALQENQATAQRREFNFRYFRIRVEMSDRYMEV